MKRLYIADTFLEYFRRGLSASCLLALLCCPIPGGQAKAASSPQSPPGETVQKVSASGRIVNPVGEPVMGAVISVKGKPELGGALSDAQGRFMFGVPADATLEIAFIGYETQQIQVQGAKFPVTLRMVDAATKIDDVVVVGYGVQQKETLVGAVSQINNKDLVNSGNTNITSALTGKLSGVLSYQTSGQPGNNDATILIRGISSWNGSAPLILVDGVERDFNDLDPNEVQSVSVLKDASATAVFGAKGANGVIIVTTRVGETGRPKMNLAVDYGLEIPTNLPDHISSYTTASMLNVAYKNAGMYESLYSGRELQEYRSPSSRLNSLRYPDNDWFDMLMKSHASTVNANFNVSGGSDRAKYFMSVGYSHEGSIIKRMHEWKNTSFQYDRINYRSNLDFKLSRTTSLSLKVGGTLGIRQAPDNASVSSLINMFYSSSPMQFPAYYPDWALEEVPDEYYPNATGSRFAHTNGAFYGNPYTALSAADFTQVTQNKLFTDAALDQKLDFITKGLSINAKVSLSTYFSRISQTSARNNPTYYIDWDVYDAGIGNPWIQMGASTTVQETPPYSVTQGAMQNTYYSTFYWEGSLNYNRKFNRHNVSALVLFNQREYLKQTEFAYRTQGVVGRVVYNYANKYLFETNLGYTGSEQFAPKNRYGFFPSVAVGYVVSQEKFWKQAAPWWNKLKFRYSDGLVGNDQTSQRWLYYSSFSSETTDKGYLIYEDAGANTEARWETARKRDLGIEMGWLSSMFTLNVDLFDEHRSDMLVTPNVPLLVGTSYKSVNNGEMKKHGLEIEVGFNRTTHYGLRYNLSAMVGLNENRIVNYEDKPYAPEYQKAAGKPYGSQRDGTTLVDGGYYATIDDIHNYPSYTAGWNEYLFPGAYKYLDYNADGLIDANDMHAIEGTKYSPTTYSLRGGMSYKGFEFSFLFYGNRGKWVDYQRNFELEFSRDLRVNKSQLDYWRPDNPNASHANLAIKPTMYQWGGGDYSAYELAIPGRTWRNADFLSLKEVYAAYTFDSNKLKERIGINSLSVYVTANNLWTTTKLLEGNPMAVNFSSGFYPMMTTIKLGVKLGF